MRNTEAILDLDEHARESNQLDYKKLLFELDSSLERLQAFSVKLGLLGSSELIARVRERLQSDAFTVAVVGEFKRGKSTFINALLGQQILPSDTLPCSATLNRVVHGTEPRVEVHFKDGASREIGIHELPAYVTKLSPESESLAETVREAVVYVDAPYVHDDVAFIDTPGLNDEGVMTEVTNAVLPDVDAAILVMSANAPLTEYECQFLEQRILTSDLGRVLFVVNGIDRCHDDADADRVVNEVRARIRERIGARAGAAGDKIGDPMVFGLSAYQALEAKLSDTAALLARSRFAPFEAALRQLLTRGRTWTTLQVPLNRIESAAQEILRTAVLHERALAMKAEEFAQAYDAALAQILTLRDSTAKEMQNIDHAAERLRERISPMIERIAASLQACAIEVVDAYEISAEQIAEPRALVEALNQEVAVALQSAAQALAHELQQELERGVIEELERLAAFSAEVSKTLEDIDIVFSQVEAQRKAMPKFGRGEMTAAMLALFTGLGGIWSGFREAGTKGAAIGAVGSVGTIAVARLIMGMMGMTMTWPAMLIIGMGSIFSGRALSRAAFGSREERIFKEAYKREICALILAHVEQAGIAEHVDRYISRSFRALRGRVQDEVGTTLDDIQRQLDDLQARRRRDEVLTESERGRLRTMAQETESIRGAARELAARLTAHAPDTWRAAE